MKRRLIAYTLCILAASAAAYGKTGTLLAVGPACSIQVSPHSATPLPPHAQVIHLESSRQWTMYLIRSEGVSYLLREKTVTGAFMFTPGQTVSFMVSKNRSQFVFKDWSGKKHHASLVHN